jgi:DNA polymerase III gamma/tau subunit
MHAYLIVGDDFQSALNSLFDKSFLSLKYSAETMDQVKDIVESTKLSVTQNTVIQIFGLENAVVETQNTLLKTLEEPQENLKFAIITRDSSNIIETIRSRCQIIETKNINIEIDKNLENFFELGVGDKFKIITKIKKREEATEFLEQLLIVGHKGLINGKVSPQKIETVVEVLENIKANGNLNLQLTLLALEGQTS